jgi:hypothetical protein
MITLTREEAQQVLDALEYNQANWQGKDKAIETLRTRLSAPEPEPGRLRRGDILRCIETNELCTVWATSTTGKTLVKWKENDFGQYTAEQIGDLFWVEPKPEPEPVAWMNESDIGRTDWKVWAHGKPTATIPLYPAPPRSEPTKLLLIPALMEQAGWVRKREWQGLTDEEIKQTTHHKVDGAYDYSFKQGAQWAEAKLKEKNT